MRVGLVARCLNTAHIRGMGRYVYELLRRSAGDPGLEWRLLGDDPRRPLLAPEGLRGEIDVFSFRGDRFQLWEQLGLPRRLARHQVDVLHCTEGTLPWWQPVPTVVTLHDTLAWQEYGDSQFERLYYERLLPAALGRCARIITISESSQRDIVAKWPALAPKVTVIPHGIGDEYLASDRPPVRSALQAGLSKQPYIVYLGGPLPRKRFGWSAQVLQACGMPDLQLVACGFGAGAREAAHAELAPEVKGRVHFAPFLSDDELLSLYKGARAVLYPTLYEGFGFPAIEAQAAGVPVVLSPVSSLAELVGPLTVTAEAHDLAAWVNALKQALAIRSTLPQLADEARSWAQRFSWARSFKAHSDVYRHACGSR